MRVAAAGLGKRAFKTKAQNLTTHSSTDLRNMGYDTLKYYKSNGFQTIVKGQLQIPDAGFHHIQLFHYYLLTNSTNTSLHFVAKEAGSRAEEVVRYDSIYVNYSICI